MSRAFDPIRRRASWSLPILALLGLLLLSLLATGAADKLRARASRLDQAEHDAKSLALLVDQHVSRAFEGIEGELERAIDKTEGQSWDQVEHSASMWRFVVKLTKAAPLLHSLELYDSGDRLRLSSGHFPTPPKGMIQFDAASFRDRIERAPDELLVGGLVQSRHDHLWYMSVGRAVPDGKGGQRGFAVGSVEPRAIRDFFRWAPIGAHGLIELLDRDGTIVVSTEASDRVAAQRTAVASLVTRVMADKSGMTVRGDVLGDGVPRILSLHPMANLPFVVLVELTQADMLQDWRRRFVFDFSVGIAVIIAFTVLSVLLHRRIVGEQRATMAARLAEQRLNDAVENTGQGFALWDVKDRLVICNRRYRELHSVAGLTIEPGIPFAKIIEASADAGIYRIEASRREWIAERVEHHRRAKGSFEQQLADGRWLLVSERRTREGGVVSIRTDITALKSKEAELERLVSALEEERERTEAQAVELARLADGFAEAHRVAAQANATKTMFLASMSHELRTPLNAILGFSEMMMRETFGPLGNNKYKEYVADVHQSGEHLLELINDVLDLSKIEAGKLELSPERQNLAELVEECVRLVSERANAKGLVLTVALPSNLPCVRADRRAAKQILLNLLSNAVKFTSAGGQVRVTGDVLDSSVAITVRDTGIGIEPNEIERLFRPFERANNAAHQEGTGLGLAIARTLAERSGGALRLESKIGEGTVVRMELPIYGEGEPIADAA